MRGKARDQTQEQSDKEKRSACGHINSQIPFCMSLSEMWSDTRPQESLLLWNESLL
jgi:hypothetical protein